MLLATMVHTWTSYKYASPSNDPCHGCHIKYMYIRS